MLIPVHVSTQINLQRLLVFVDYTTLWMDHNEFNAYNQITLQSAKICCIAAF